jgi:hypothetical protein
MPGTGLRPKPSESGDASNIGLEKDARENRRAPLTPGVQVVVGLKSVLRIIMEYQDENFRSFFLYNFYCVVTKCT